MLNLAPWYYRNFFGNNPFIEKMEFYNVELFDGQQAFESNAFLKKSLRPSWLTSSIIYKNCDGTGTDLFKNIAVYKAISEALERLAFYSLAESEEKKYFFDVNPTTTGMASFPHFASKYARNNARLEAVERWAIHEFNRSRVPVIAYLSSYPQLNSYEIVVPFSDVKVCLLSLLENNFYSYAFAAGSDFAKAHARARIELNRNRTVILKAQQKGLCEFSDTVDKTLTYYASREGYDNFLDKINSAPKKVSNFNPRVLCDLELTGPWSKYTKVWRFLLEDSYFDCSADHTFFMF